MPSHTVADGEGLPRIARRFGFHAWAKIWHHADNDELRSKRSNPHVLHPGDTVFVPEKETKTLSGGTEQCHRFLCKLPALTETLRVQLENRDGSAMAGLPYELVLDTGETLEDSTDDDGYLTVEVPIDATSGLLRVDDSEWQLEFDTLNPVDEETTDSAISGAQARLCNLGYRCEENGSLDDATKAALSAFQRDAELSVSGELDDATRSALRDRHGS